MTPQAFGDYWRATFPDCPPVAHLLRQAYAQRWLRIHTLPESKRYAQDAVEYREILHRHNTMLAEVIGWGQPCILVLTGYSDTPEPVLSQSWLRAQYPTSQPFLSTLMEHDPSPLYWHFFMQPLRCEPGIADPLLRRVADDAARDVLFVRVERTTLYMPYDGGGDVIFTSTAARDVMRHRYAAWLSAHPSGL